jgi:hypothetical protein
MNPDSGQLKKVAPLPPPSQKTQQSFQIKFP